MFFHQDCWNPSEIWEQSTASRMETEQKLSINSPGIRIFIKCLASKGIFKSLLNNFLESSHALSPTQFFSLSLKKIISGAFFSEGRFLYAQRFS